MSSLLRPLASTAARASKQLSARSFHSPYTVLGESPLTTPSSSTYNNAYAKYYEKENDYAHEPFQSLSGHRTYVVSEPDASFRHYEVPAGAYPTSSPYINFRATEAPVYDAEDISSTAADILAHPFTSRAALNEAEAAKAKSSSSSNSNNAQGVAPGAMGRRGGSYGGIRGAAKPAKLGERGPQPDVQNTWKMAI